MDGTRRKKTGRPKKRPSEMHENEGPTSSRRKGADHQDHSQENSEPTCITRSSTLRRGLPILQAASVLQGKTTGREIATRQTTTSQQGASILRGMTAGQSSRRGESACGEAEATTGRRESPSSNIEIEEFAARPNSQRGRVTFEADVYEDQSTTTRDTDREHRDHRNIELVRIEQSRRREKLEREIERKRERLMRESMQLDQLEREMELENTDGPLSRSELVVNNRERSPLTDSGVRDDGVRFDQCHTFPTSSNSSDFLRITENLVHAITRAVDSASSGNDSRRIVNRLAAGALPRFDGNPSRWLRFKQAFELSTELGGFSDRENVARLYGALEGNARDAVEGIMIGANSANEIFKLLEMRFGNSDVVIGKIAKDLRKLPKINASGEEIVSFATKLKGGVAAMQALGHTGYLNSPELVRDLIFKLPTEITFAFDAYVNDANKSDPRLVTLSNFLYQRAEMSCRAGTNVRNEVRDVSRINRNRNPANFVCVTTTNSKPTSALGSSVDRSNGESNCQFCFRSSHHVNQCRDLANLTEAERWNWVKRYNLCFKCLSKDHHAAYCPNGRSDRQNFRAPMLHSTNHPNAAVRGIAPPNNSRITFSKEKFKRAGPKNSRRSNLKNYKNASREEPSRNGSQTVANL